eukprot:222965_1
MAPHRKIYKHLRRVLIHHHSSRLSSSKIIYPTNNILSFPQPHINIQKRHIDNPGEHFSPNFSTKEQFPGGKFNIPPATGQSKRPSIRVGGGGISLGPEFEPELKDLPWEPVDIHPERPPPGYMNVDGFYDDDIQVDGKKYNHSLLIMPQFVTKWNVNSIEDITAEHFALATIHYPAIRHIFVGCGYNMPCPTPPEWSEYLNKYKISVEINGLATAARLFNMQNTLFQNFACALVYEKDVVRRFHNLVKKSELGILDPADSTAGKPKDGESWYYGRKKW